MSRAWMIVVGVAACSGSGSGSEPGTDEPARGIRHLSVSVAENSIADKEAAKYFLDVSYDYKPIATIDKDKGGSFEVRAACQVGALRLVDDEMQYDEVRRPSRRQRATPFILSGLRERPTLCDLGFYEIPTYGATPQPIEQVCAYRNKAPVKGECPANPVVGDGTGGGFSVPSLEIEFEPAKPGEAMPSPDELVLRYAVQAHRDQDKNTWVEVAIACEGSASDSVSHNEAAKLRAGESFSAGQIKLADRVPPPETPCRVTFTALAGLDGARVPIETFCYRNLEVTRGDCAP